MSNFPKLINPPIKEIIFTISFSDNIDIEKLDSFKNIPSIQEDFPSITKNIEIGKSKDYEYVLKNEKYLMHPKIGSFSFHRINGYEDYETLVKSIQKYWALFIETCGSLNITNISVRYMNFIEMRQGEKQEELLNIYPKHPFGDSVNSSFMQHKFLSGQVPDLIINVICATTRIDNKVGLVLDILLNKEIKSSSDFNFDSLNELRDIKNDIFFRCITPITKNKYN